MKVPIKEAINSSAWHQCQVNDFDTEIDFRIRFLSFERITLELVDDPDKIEENLGDGILWLLRGEVISLYKKKIDACDISSNIILVDQDDFEFETITDWHLTGDSEYAKWTGLNAFSQGDLVPKIRMKGALLFLLPDDNEAEYFLSVQGGKIQKS